MERFVERPEPPGTPVVLFAGRMLWEKGVGDFVEAARLVRARGVDARFVLVGTTDPGNPGAVPPERLESWRAGGDVEWWGASDRMPDVYAQCHVFCFPTRYGEGVPRVLIEAAATGRAVITTDTPGCREVVRHGATGLLVPVRSPEAVAAAVDELLRDPVRRAAMGRAGRGHVEARFSVARVLAVTMALYDRVAERALARRRANAR